MNDADAPEAVVLFDGVCNMCDATVQFIVRHDPSARFRFAPLGSPAAQQLLSASSAHGPLPDSVVLIEHARVYTRSTAALRITRSLRFPWTCLYAFILLPRILRDPVYDFIARHRYRWFGKKDTCMIPTPALRARFLR
jgi:predicted DCC family thiol-disulfide oxidoreductase YuxK